MLRSGLHFHIMKKLILLIIFTAGVILNSSAQGVPQLNAFNIQENNRIVFLNWEISSGFVCSGIRIQRSDDGIHFNQIGEIYGVCGSLITAVTYNFTDSTPLLNASNYYRLEFGDGNFSTVLSVEVRTLNSEGYQLRVDPGSGSAEISFSNKQHKLHTLSMYTVQGNQVLRVNTTTDSFRVDLSVYAGQLLVFSIAPANGGGKVISGKLAVVR